MGHLNRTVSPDASARGQPAHNIGLLRAQRAVRAGLQQRLVPAAMGLRVGRGEEDVPGPRERAVQHRRLLRHP